MRCKGCGKDINGAYIEALDATWHSDCFVCGECGKGFAGGFQEDDGKPYHGECLARRKGQICGRCSKPVVGQVVTAMDKAWHPACFVCAGCGGDFEGGFCIKDGQPCHAGCSPKESILRSAPATASGVEEKNIEEREKEKSPRRSDSPRATSPVQDDDNSQPSRGREENTCKKCGKELRGQIIEALDARWHVECFTCSKCGGKFEGSFVVRDGLPCHSSCVVQSYSEQKPPEDVASNAPQGQKPPVGAAINAIRDGRSSDSTNLDRTERRGDDNASRELLAKPDFGMEGITTDSLVASVARGEAPDLEDVLAMPVKEAFTIWPKLAEVIATRLGAAMAKDLKQLGAGGNAVKALVSNLRDEGGLGSLPEERFARVFVANKGGKLDGAKSTFVALKRAGILCKLIDSEDERCNRALFSPGSGFKGGSITLPIIIAGDRAWWSNSEGGGNFRSTKDLVDDLIDKGYGPKEVVIYAMQNDPTSKILCRQFDLMGIAYSLVDLFSEVNSDVNIARVRLRPQSNDKPFDAATWVAKLPKDLGKIDMLRALPGERPLLWLRFSNSSFVKLFVDRHRKNESLDIMDIWSGSGGSGPHVANDEQVWWSIKDDERVPLAKELSISGHCHAGGPAALCRGDPRRIIVWSGMRCPLTYMMWAALKEEGVIFEPIDLDYDDGYSEVMEANGWNREEGGPWFPIVTHGDGSKAYYKLSSGDQWGYRECRNLGRVLRQFQLGGPRPVDPLNTTALTAEQKTDVFQTIEELRYDEIPEHRSENKSREWYVLQAKARLEKFGQMLIKMYDEKPGDILDELLTTLRSPGNMPPETDAPTVKELQHMAYADVENNFPNFKKLVDEKGCAEALKKAWGPEDSYHLPQFLQSMRNEGIFGDLPKQPFCLQALLLELGERYVSKHRATYPGMAKPDGVNTDPSMLALIFCTLYTMEGPDIDKLMQFKKVPKGGGAKYFEKYFKTYGNTSQWEETGTEFGSRPRLRTEVIRNQALYVEVNWSMRVIAMILDLEESRTLTPEECKVKNLARESLRSWIKGFCTLIAVAASPLEKTYNKSVETVVRGVNRLSDEDMRKHSEIDKKGNVLGWTAVSSTAVSQKAAESFAGKGNCITFTIDNVFVGTYMKPLSVYPHEEEIIVPALLEFDVSSLKQQSPNTANIEMRVGDSLFNSVDAFREFRERVLRDCCAADARLQSVRDLVEPKAMSRELIVRVDGDIKSFNFEAFEALKEELLKAVGAQQAVDASIDVIPGSIVAMVRYAFPWRAEHRNDEGGDRRAQEEVDRCYEAFLKFGTGDNGSVPADSPLRLVGRWMKNVTHVRAANPLIPTGNRKVDFELKQMYDAIASTGLPPIEAARKKKIPFIDLEFSPRDDYLPQTAYTAKHDCEGKQQNAIQVFGECRLDESIIWERCTVLHPSPVVFGKDVGAQDINQGRLGDCWFMSALSILAEEPALVYSLLPAKSQNLSDGFLEFCCCKGDWWTNTTIDTYLPTSKGHGGPVYGHGRWIEEEKKAGVCIARGATKEQWVSFVEKGYAKINGSYGNIVGGDAAHAFTDLTGAPADTVAIKEDLFADVLKWHQAGHLLACNTPDDRVEELKSIGLASKHSYGILDVRQIERHQLLKVRNPWGCFEWKGGLGGDAESDASLYRQLGFEELDDGIFWICWRDLCKYMTGVTVCYRHRGAQEVRVRCRSNEPLVLAVWLRGSGTVHVAAHQLTRLGSASAYASVRPMLLMQKSAREHEIVAGQGARYVSGRDVNVRAENLSPPAEGPCIAFVDFHEDKESSCVLSVSTMLSVERYEVWSGADWKQAISKSAGSDLVPSPDTKKMKLVRSADVQVNKATVASSLA